MTFNKMIVAKHSPQNGCLSEDGEMLYLPPPIKWPAKERSHEFRGVNSDRRNKYGWVVEAREGIDLREVGSLLGEARVMHPNFVAMQEQMLTAIAKMDVGTSVSVDFFKRGIPPKLELVVHRVIFHKP